MAGNSTFGPISDIIWNITTWSPFNTTDFMNSNNTSNTTDDYYYDDYLCEFEDSDFWAEPVDYYATYVISIVGVVSNVIALFVLLGSSRIRNSPSGILLISLTSDDTLVLVLERIHSLSYPTEQSPLGPYMTSMTCGVVWYFKYTSRLAASYIVVCISINRLIVVVFPLKSRYFTDTKNAIIQVVCTVIISSILCSWAPVFTEARLGIGCDIKTGYYKAYFNTTLIIDVILCDILSSIIIITLSVWTIRTALKARRWVRRCSSIDKARSRHEDQQLTGLLLAVCLSFALLRLPYIVTWFPVILLEECAKHVIPAQNAFHIAHFVALLNHAINLYLYCLCSASFRGEFASFCKCGIRFFPSGGKQWRSLVRSISQRSTNIASHSTSATGTHSQNNDTAI